MYLPSCRKISKAAPFWNIVVVSKTWNKQVKLMFYYLSILFCSNLFFLSVITPSVFSLFPFHLFNFFPLSLLQWLPFTLHPFHWQTNPSSFGGLALGREGGLQWMSIPVVSEVTAAQRSYWQQHSTPQFARAGMCDTATVQSDRNRAGRIS